MPDLETTTQQLWKEVFEDNEPWACFNCSTCVSGCPASEADPPLMIRNLVRMVLLGMEDELFDEDSPWTCVTCSRCEEMCPMGVKPFELCLAVRRWQSTNDETRLPPSVVEIFKTGYTQAIERDSELRQKVGLTDAPPTMKEHPELLEQFQKLLFETKLVQNNDFMFKG